MVEDDQLVFEDQMAPLIEHAAQNVPAYQLARRERCVEALRFMLASH